MSKDLTVSKLSKLQKQILVYARRQMLAKGQKIEPRGHVDVRIPAPTWLAEALTTALKKVFFTRKTQGALEDGNYSHYQVHRWVFFFEEISFVEDSVRKAAKEADVESKDLRLTQLFIVAMPFGIVAAMAASKMKCAYRPWPSYSSTMGWHFHINVTNKTAAEIHHLFTSKIGHPDLGGITLDDSPVIPENCTVPEMLRDLLGLPLREPQPNHDSYSKRQGGDIGALAFSPHEIGGSRYNTAQASLRRACTRLRQRRLIVGWSGQSHTLVWNTYNRSAIGLTEAGLGVADALITQMDQTAQADVGVA
jgi:hypothetical protein